MKPKLMTQAEYRKWLTWAKVNLFPIRPEYETALLDGRIVITDDDDDEIDDESDENEDKDE